ncbi:uncharacterized protein V6R79_007605 [Siganus canaliculatus]
MNQTQLRSHQPFKDRLRGNALDSLTLKSIIASRNHDTGIMAEKNTAIPRLVVKIVGSKQVKQFIEEPPEDAADKSHPKHPADALGKSPEKRGSDRRLRDGVDSALWEVISREGVSEDRDKTELSSAVREELSDWQLSSLSSAEDDVAALDLTFSGTLSRSEITHLFLKHHVPMKLSTFSQLLHTFSDQNNPDQIDYRNLLQFIRRAAFPDDLHSVSEVNLLFKQVRFLLPALELKTLSPVAPQRDEAFSS